MSVFEFPILSLVRKQYSLICCRYLTIYIVTLNELNSHIILELFPKIKFWRFSEDLLYQLFGGGGGGKPHESTYGAIFKKKVNKKREWIL